MTINTATITPIAMPALAPALSPPPELEHVYDPLNTPSAASRSKSPQDTPEPEMLVSPLTWSMLGRDILPNLANMDEHGKGRDIPKSPVQGKTTVDILQIAQIHRLQRVIPLYL